MERKKVRYTERFNQQPPPSAAISATTNPIASRPQWPWEEHENILKQISEGFKETHAVLDRIEKADKKNTHIIIQLDTSVQKEILAVVKETLELIKKIDSGLTKAQEDALASQLHESRTGLQEAVEANQPPDTGSVKKKKKSK